MARKAALAFNNKLGRMAELDQIYCAVVFRRKIPNPLHGQSACRLGWTGRPETGASRRGGITWPLKPSPRRRLPV
jgi:hypothetical protein